MVDKTNLKAVFSLLFLLLLFERSHRNQAWPPASVNGEVGRGQNVNLVTCDIPFFLMLECSKHVLGDDVASLAAGKFNPTVVFLCLRGKML